MLQLPVKVSGDFVTETLIGELRAASLKVPSKPVLQLGGRNVLFMKCNEMKCPESRKRDRNPNELP